MPRLYKISGLFISITSAALSFSIALSKSLISQDDEPKDQGNLNTIGSECEDSNVIILNSTKNCNPVVIPEDNQ